MSVKLQLNSSESYQSQLKALSQCIDIIRKGPEVLDLGNPNWVDPLLTLSLSALIDKYSQKVCGLSSYLKTVCFPKGVSDVDLLRKQKTYIPGMVL